MQRLVASLHPKLAAVVGEVAKIPADDMTIDVFHPLIALQADVRGVGGCLSSDDCHVLFRASGVLQQLCALCAAACNALTRVSNAAVAVAPPSGDWFTAFQSVCMTLAATVEIRTNRAVIMSSGVISAAAELIAANAANILVTNAAPGAPIDVSAGSVLEASQLQFMPGVLTFVEVLVSTKDVDVLNALNKHSALLPACLSYVTRFVTDPSTNPAIEECACHGASVIQVRFSRATFPGRVAFGHCLSPMRDADHRVAV